jgi:hypothetical protein
MAMVTATIEFQPPACSSVRARVVMRAVIPIAAVTAPRTRSATPNGSPHSAPRRNVEASTSTVIATIPSAKLPIALPSTIAHGPIGAATSRGRVPSRRSVRSDRTPNWAVKKRKKIAMLAA